MPCVNLQLCDWHEYQRWGLRLKPAGQTVHFQAAPNWASLPPSSLLCGSSRNSGINELECESAFIRCCVLYSCVVQGRICEREENAC